MDTIYSHSYTDMSMRTYNILNWENLLYWVGIMERDYYTTHFHTDWSMHGYQNKAENTALWRLWKGYYGSYLCRRPLQICDTGQYLHVHTVLGLLRPKAGFLCNHGPPACTQPHNPDMVIWGRGREKSWSNAKNMTESSLAPRLSNFSTHAHAALKSWEGAWGRGYIDWDHYIVRGR